MQAMQGDWLPARAALHPTGLYLALREIRPAELQDPFMQETIARIPARESVVQVAREDVGKGAAGTSPAGIVFHVARCGSTLVSQLLKQHVGVVVYAEPLPVNEILLPPHKWPRAELVAALRSLGAAFARHARKPWVWKLTSWNTLFCDLVCRGLPGDALGPVPARTRRGVGFAPGKTGGLDLGGRPAGRAFREGDRPRGRVALARGVRRAPLRRVLRRGGPPRSRTRRARRLRIAAGRRLGERSRRISGWPSTGPPARACRRPRGMNSKAPIGRPEKFAGDAADKQAAASEDLRRAIDAYARPALGRLKALHAGEHA